jgi:Flp pilus assembly protein CpaB
MPDLTRLRSLPRSLRRSLLRRRRLLAAVCAFVAVLAGLRATAAPLPETVRVTVAARDLGAGTRLSAADLTTVSLPPEAVPAGRIRDPVGRELAGPLRRGAPLTDASVLGPGLVRDRPGLVAMPVRLPDTAMAGLLRLGERVDLLATDPAGSGPASTVVRDALVLALPPPPEGAATDGLPGRLVVLGVPSSAVTSVSSVAVTRFLSVAWAG